MDDMNPVFAMLDMQSSHDTRRIPIQRVGIRGVRYPMSLQTPSGALNTVGTYSLDVHLPADQKGTHMSRFVALLKEECEPLDLAQFQLLLEKMLEKLEADAGHIEVHFPYFVSRTAPVSGVQSLMDYEVMMIGEMRDGHTKVRVKALVPVMSLCPCLKKISQYGAHNQHSHITIDAELAADTPVEALIRMAEEETSCELWGLLKHPDEKLVTKRAYENPKFVEGLVHDIIIRLNQDDRTVAYTLEAENFESIHNYSAYALIERDKRSNK